jgi:iron(III) transport system permease protein
MPKQLAQRAPMPPWLLASVLLGASLLWPLLSLIQTALSASFAQWQHLAEFVLPNALRNTLLLLLGVGLCSMLIGCVCAWLVSAFDFTGRRLLSWALLLPLAMPTYIVAFAYTDLLHPLGPLQSALREVLGLASPRDLRLPDPRSLPMLIALVALVLYPYVYLSVRALFLTQAGSLLDAGRSLGVGGVGLFWRLALPLARPAVVLGTTLVLLETLNDIGAAKIIGIETLTTAIYSTWVTRSDLATAAQIALAMLLFVVALLVLERWARSEQRFAAQQRAQPMHAQPLKGAKAMAAIAMCLWPVLLGFVLPLAYLLYTGSARWWAHGVSERLLEFAFNSLQLAVLVSALTIALGWLLSFALRARPGRFLQLLLHCGSIGYAIPGVVLAIALLGPFARMDASLVWLAESLQITPVTLMLGGLSGVVLACSLRFLAIAMHGLEAGYARIPLHIDYAASSLGASAGARAWHIHRPLLRTSMAAAALLVFIDTMKELPATLLLRPLNFDTLATALYAEAARGSYEDGALAALLIVLIGLPAVALLARVGSTSARA